MLIILDRDGVINEDSPDFIKKPEEWQPIPGSLSAIAALNQAGHIVTIATNQSGIARGLFTEQDLLQIHQKMINALAAVGGHIDAIFYCPHHPDDHCPCRKPKPGMMEQIAAKYQLPDFQQAILIGDAERDIDSARAVQCRAILVKTGKGMSSLEKSQTLQEVPVFANLAEAVRAILRKEAL